MFVGSLLPRAIYARKRRAVPPAPPRIASRPVWQPAEQTLLPGSAEVETEVRAALAAVSEAACNAHIELQLACAPRLCAFLEPAVLRTCLRDLLAAAIARAGSGVLVTSAARADSIEIAILDDGPLPPGAAAAAAPAPDALPDGARCTAAYSPGRGTVMTLLVPLAAVPGASDAEGAAELI